MKRVSLIWFLVILNLCLLLTILAKFFNPGVKLFILPEYSFASRSFPHFFGVIIMFFSSSTKLLPRQSPSHRSTKSDCFTLGFHQTFFMFCWFVSEIPGAHITLTSCFDDGAQMPKISFSVKQHMIWIQTHYWEQRGEVIFRGIF